MISLPTSLDEVHTQIAERTHVNFCEPAARLKRGLDEFCRMCTTCVTVRNERCLCRWDDSVSCPRSALRLRSILRKLIHPPKCIHNYGRPAGKHKIFRNAYLIAWKSLLLIQQGVTDIWNSIAREPGYESRDQPRNYARVTNAFRNAWQLDPYLIPPNFHH